MKGNSNEFSICSDRHHLKNLMTFLQMFFLANRNFSFPQILIWKNCFVDLMWIFHLPVIMFFFNSKEIWFRSDGWMLQIGVWSLLFNCPFNSKGNVSDLFKNVVFWARMDFYQASKMPKDFEMRNSDDVAIFRGTWENYNLWTSGKCPILHLIFENSRTSTKFQDGCVTWSVIFSIFQTLTSHFISPVDIRTFNPRFNLQPHPHCFRQSGNKEGVKGSDTHHSFRFGLGEGTIFERTISPGLVAREQFWREGKIIFPYKGLPGTRRIYSHNKHSWTFLAPQAKILANMSFPIGNLMIQN